MEMFLKDTLQLLFMALGLFKSREEKEREAREKARNQEYEERRRSEDQKRAEILDQVIFTPESKSEYELRVGYLVEVIDTDEQDKGVIFEKDGGRFKGGYHLEKRLAEAGIEAVVETSISFKTIVSIVRGGGPYDRIKTETTQFYYGLPVARKKGGPYR